MKRFFAGLFSVVVGIIIVAGSLLVYYRPPIKGIEKYIGNGKIYSHEDGNVRMYITMDDKENAELYVVQKMKVLGIPYDYGTKTKYSYSSLKYTSLLRYFNYLPRTDLSLLSLPDLELVFLTNIAFFDSHKEQRAAVQLYPTSMYGLNIERISEEAEMQTIKGILTEKEDSLEIGGSLFNLLSGEKLEEAEKTIDAFEKYGFLIK